MLENNQDEINNIVNVDASQFDIVNQQHNSKYNNITFIFILSERLGSSGKQCAAIACIACYKSDSCACTASDFYDMYINSGR